MRSQDNDYPKIIQIIFSHPGWTPDLTYEPKLLGLGSNGVVYIIKDANAPEWDVYAEKFVPFL